MAGVVPSRRSQAITCQAVDGQSVKTTESGGVCGYGTVKKVKEPKRHIMTDTLALLLFAVMRSLRLWLKPPQIPAGPRQVPTLAGMLASDQKLPEVGGDLGVVYVV